MERSFHNFGTLESSEFRSSFADAIVFWPQGIQFKLWRPCGVGKPALAIKKLPAAVSSLMNGSVQSKIVATTVHI